MFVGLFIEVVVVSQVVVRNTAERPTCPHPAPWVLTFCQTTVTITAGMLALNPSTESEVPGFTGLTCTCVCLCARVWSAPCELISCPGSHIRLHHRDAGCFCGVPVLPFPAHPSRTHPAPLETRLTWKQPHTASIFIGRTWLVWPPRSGGSTSASFPGTCL